MTGLMKFYNILYLWARVVHDIAFLELGFERFQVSISGWKLPTYERHLHGARQDNSLSVSPSHQ